MFTSKKRIVIAIALALYLYFLLPATATMFYELYHFTGFGPLYWVYGGFKAGGYYLGVWAYQIHTCIALGLAVLVIPALWQRVKGN